MLSRLAYRNAPMLQIAARNLNYTSDNPPRLIRPVEPGPVKYGFIPEEFFTFFYPKTGVSGPYIFAASVATYLISKEIYVLEHEFYNGISLFILCVYGIKKFGKPLREFVKKDQENIENELIQSRENEIKARQDCVDELKHEQWRTEGHALLSEAKRENVKMQLEAVYRERLALVYKEVKRRLDYQLQVQNIERRIAQRHMAQWIINGVMKAITPDQEKAALQQCISDLQALASKA